MSVFTLNRELVMSKTKSRAEEIRAQHKSAKKKKSVKKTVTPGGWKHEKDMLLWNAVVAFVAAFEKKCIVDFGRALYALAACDNAWPYQQTGEYFGFYSGGGSQMRWLELRGPSRYAYVLQDLVAIGEFDFHGEVERDIVRDISRIWSKQRIEMRTKVQNTSGDVAMRKLARTRWLNLKVGPTDDANTVAKAIYSICDDPALEFEAERSDV